MLATVLVVDSSVHLIQTTIRAAFPKNVQRLDLSDPITKFAVILTDFNPVSLVRIDRGLRKRTNAGFGFPTRSNSFIGAAARAEF